MSIKLPVLTLVFILPFALETLVRAQSPCDVQELVVGEASGLPGEQIEVALYGGVSCEVTGFSVAIGHDPTRLLFVNATPGQFIVDHAGADLSFYVTDRNDGGYALIGAFFDISFPVTVLPTTIARGTVLATMTYEILFDASPGTTSLLNRTRTYGGPIPMSNVYSRPPGDIPVEPLLVDGRVTIGGTETTFRRGDDNGDGELDISDAIFLLVYLFAGGQEPGCQKSADADDSGTLDLTDAMYLLDFAFLLGPAPPSPFQDCGVDPTPDDLSCGSHELCP